MNNNELYSSYNDEKENLIDLILSKGDINKS